MAVLTRAFEWVETRLDRGLWFRRALAVATILIAIRLTDWGMGFANAALASKASLLDAAALISAVAGIPLALLTLLFNRYVESR